MKKQIQVVSSEENLKKVQEMFLKNDTEVSYFRCDCKRMNFFKNDQDLTIMYPNKILPECIACVQKAKVNSNIFFLSNELDIQQMIDFICAGAEDCFTKETFYLVERAAKELSNNLFFKEG